MKKDHPIVQARRVNPRAERGIAWPRKASFGARPMQMGGAIEHRYRRGWKKKVALPLGCIILCGWLSGLGFGQQAPSQANGGAAQSTEPQPPQGERDALTSGLLDLVEEPAAAPTNNPPENPTARPTPAEVGLEGEDLGEQSENPLAAVRQSMLIAADYLQRGHTDAGTQQLQADIVRRLDDVIEQIDAAARQASLQRRSASSQRDSSTRESEQSSTSEPPQSEKATSQSLTGAEQERERPAEAAEPVGDQPGGTGAAANSQVDLSDPRALQHSVWGQLPEQVRKQMQSRMVEQFLPSYREQIEAYFEALLEAE